MLFQGIALFILLFFYGCYFGKMLMQRRQGIETDQMGKGKTGRVLLIERTLKAATFAAVLGEVTGVLLNTTCLPSWARWLGAAMALLGTIAFILSVATMRDNWRAGVPATDQTELVTTGIYQISRNPAFLGFDLVYIGLLLMFCSWWLAALSILAIIMIHLQIVLVEEPFLHSVFGRDYQQYTGKVRRYLGRN